MSNHALLWLTSYVVNGLWQVAILAAAAWCLARWVKPAGPELQHKIWVATLILAALVPATPVIQSWFTHQTLTGHASTFSPAVAGRLAARPIPLRASDLIVQPAAVYLVSGFYLALLLFSFLRLCRGLHRTAALVRNAELASPAPDYADLWRAAKERVCVQSAALLRSQDVPGPMTAGLWRPVLLLPATLMEDYSASEFQAAVAHECAHMKRDDFRKNLFYQMVGLFTVFHPLTWFIKSQIAQTREMICDRMAAQQLPDRRAYAISLLQLANKMVPATPVASHAMGMFDTGILEKRIMILTTSIPRLSRGKRRLLTVTATLLLSICAGGIGSMTQTVAAQTARPSTKPPDLSCTYYDDKTVPHEGTCGYDKNDKTKYSCYLSSDMTISQSQIGCEYKVRRAEEWKKSQK